MKTELERTAYCIMRIYHQYCILNPQDDYLQFKEFEKLVKEQFAIFLKDTKTGNITTEAHIKNLFDQADKDKSGALTFSEFMSFFQLPLEDAHNRSHRLDKEGCSCHLHARDFGF